MARQSKTKTTESTETVPAPAPATVEKSKVKATPAPVVVETAPEASSVAETEVAKFSEETVSAQVDDYVALITRLSSELAGLKKDLIQFKKESTKGIKALKKNAGKRHRKTDGVPRQSGFTKPVRVVPEFADFLGIARDELISRTNACTRLNMYFKEKGLTEGRVIHYKRDAALAALFRYDGEEPFRFLNLQKAIKHLFVKEVPVVATA